ncbi:MAG: ornithine carbamoyltransferase [Coriobacteriales bacterium]|jgi:ornithine carbamoyltransferase|nr:ornithine carbamoyltransferase [Coriobacteriales bacterium]
MIDDSHNPLVGRDLLRLLDLTPDEFGLILERALADKAAWRCGQHDQSQQGKAVAVIMEKPSLRTRVSFEVGAERLGAHAVVLADDHSAFSRGETIKDTVKVLERFVDCIVLRTFAQAKVEEVAKWAQIPVINALTDDFHPCQGLTDFMCIYEHKAVAGEPVLSALAKLKIAYLGDGNNMAHTYLEAAALAGASCAVATPEDFGPDPKIVAECQALAARTGATLSVGCDPAYALSGADVVLTDTWTSMGQEGEHDQRIAPFAGFQIDAAKMALASSDAIFMHCLPAHRGEEVVGQVIDGDQSVIYDEAEDRLHSEKTLMNLLMG